MTIGEQARPSLARLLRPTSIAIVGASESSVMSQTAESNLAAEGVEVFLVTPRYETVWGRKTVPTLANIGRPVDAVFSLLSATGTVGLAEEAVGLDVGGLVTVASGFAEVAGDGADLQTRLLAAAASGGWPVVGPNCVGYVDVRRHLDLTFLPRFERRAGGVSVVAHSGALLEAFAAASHRVGGVGLNLMISAGNEAVTDMADYLDYLVDDRDTRIIVLAVEKLRRPPAFFAAAERARRCGKPIVAIKLGRSERGRRMAQSHTGTITGDSWVYEVAFAQAGIATALEVDELVDRVQFLEQVPNKRWTAVRGLGVLTGTGGFAAMAADLGSEDGIDIPEVPALTEKVRALIPGADGANPLDGTGVILTNLDVWTEMISAFESAPEIDAMVFLSQFGEWDQRSRRFSDSFAEAADRSSKPFVLSPLAGNAGPWMSEYCENHATAIGNGLRGTMRAFHTMGRFVRGRPDGAVHSPDGVPPHPLPAGELIESEGERMLPFATAMSLLRFFGIPTAPFHLARTEADLANVGFVGPYVVKLADVAHRTEHGAVLVDVARDGLTDAHRRLIAIAAAEGLRDTVVLQPKLAGRGEAFIGLSDSELGPLVAFGIGGIFVEVLGRVAGRLAPFAAVDAAEMIAEFDDIGVFDGLRGAPAWSRPVMERLLVDAGQLVAACRSWLGSLDINPLIETADGMVAVDAACFVKPTI